MTGSLADQAVRKARNLNRLDSWLLHTSMNAELRAGHKCRLRKNHRNVPALNGLRLSHIFRLLRQLHRCQMRLRVQSEH